MDVLGPLGRGFWREEGRERLILIGGGIGIAPLLPWAEELTGEKRKGQKAGQGNLGLKFSWEARSADRLLGVREIKKMGLEPQVATEDGSLGLPGMATDLLERELLSQDHESTVIYACGPMAMLARVAQIAEQFDVPCQVLLESRMACGVGACLGCAVKIRDGGKRGGRDILLRRRKVFAAPGKIRRRLCARKWRPGFRPRHSSATGGFARKGRYSGRRKSCGSDVRGRI